MKFKVVLSACTAFLLSLTYVLAGDHIEIPEGSLNCVLKVEKAVINNGEVPKLEIKLANNSGKDIFLAGSLDGSSCKWRYPYCYFEVIGPDGKPVETKYSRCGNTNPLEEKNFKEVKNGASFRPYQKGFFGSYQIQKNTFSKQGVYKVKFIYSSAEKDIQKWAGRFSLKNIIESPILTERFLATPKVKVESNVIEITVK